jgi:hypothetical protein
MVETAWTSPAMKNWPPRVLLLYDLPDFRIVRLDSRDNRPRWMSQVRRGTSTTVGKGRFGKMEKHSWRQFLGISRVMSDTWHAEYPS